MRNENFAALQTKKRMTDAIEAIIKSVSTSFFVTTFINLRTEKKQQLISWKK